jgi:hypothetical protein
MQGSIYIAIWFINVSIHKGFCVVQLTKDFRLCVVQFTEYFRLYVVQYIPGFRLYVLQFTEDFRWCVVQLTRFLGFVLLDNLFSM